MPAPDWVYRLHTLCGWGGTDKSTERIDEDALYHDFNKYIDDKCSSDASCCSVARGTDGRSWAAAAAPRRRCWPPPAHGQPACCVDVTRTRRWGGAAAEAAAGGRCEAGWRAVSSRAGAVVVAAVADWAASRTRRRATLGGADGAAAAAEHRHCRPAARRHWHTASTCSSSVNSPNSRHLQHNTTQLPVNSSETWHSVPLWGHGWGIWRGPSMHHKSLPTSSTAHLHLAYKFYVTTYS